MTTTKRFSLKHFVIKSLSIILALITCFTVLTAFPLQASATSAEKDIPTYAEFKADYYLNFPTPIITLPTLASDYLALLEDDATLRITRNIWEAAHMADEPSYLAGKITDVERYKLALFDLLLGSMDEDHNVDLVTQAITNEQLQYVTSVTSEIIKDIKVKDLASVKVTAENINFLQKIAESTATQTAFHAFSAISDIYSVYQNMQEFIESYAKYQAIANLGDGVKKILIAIAADESNPTRLRIAATECITHFDSAFASILRLVLNNDSLYSDIVISSIVPEVMDSAWADFVMTNELGLPFVAIKGIRVLANSIFDIDQSNMYYYALGACVDIENALVKIGNDAKTIYQASPSHAERGPLGGSHGGKGHR